MFQPSESFILYCPSWKFSTLSQESKRRKVMINMTLKSYVRGLENALRKYSTQFLACCYAGLQTLPPHEHFWEFILFHEDINYTQKQIFSRWTFCLNSCWSKSLLKDWNRGCPIFSINNWDGIQWFTGCSIFDRLVWSDIFNERQMLVLFE